MVAEREIEIKSFDNGKTITLNNFLYVPDIVANLISVTMKNIYHLNFENDSCNIINPDN